MKKIDLNCDLGESFGAYTIGSDSEVLPFISSANIACGLHAGDPSVMLHTVKLAGEHGVGIGAHPGLPDLVGFGRRNMDISVEDAKACVLYQIGALSAFCRASGVPFAHVKAHGALYNMAGKNYNLAKAICEAVASFNPSLILLALSGSEMIRAAKDTGLRCAKEVFADRAYEDDGSLVARTKPGAMITDENEAIARVVRMVSEGKVTSITGKDISIEAESVCVHGDGEKAVLFVKKLHSAFQEAGIAIVPLSGIA
jgi:5-oxoprolinase (ATP-hydrolysing) subunit A